MRRIRFVQHLLLLLLFQRVVDSSDDFNLTGHADQAYVQDIMRFAKASEMRNYMDLSVEPCQNFYAFACGNWAKINPVDADEHITTGLFEVMSKALDRKIVKLLRSEVSDMDTETDKKVKSFYKSCMRFSHLRPEYKQQLRELIADFGEMPVLQEKSDEEWEDSDFDWLETIAKILRRYGKGIILSLEILPDFSENTVNRVYIGFPDFPLESKSVYVDAVTATYRTSYRAKITDDLMRYLNVPIKRAKKTAAEILNFEIALAQGMIDERLGLDIDEISTATTIDNMQQRYAPTIDIKRFVQLVLGQQVNGTIFEFAADYQVNLKSVIQRTPKRIVANYIFYSLLDDFLLKSHKNERKQESTCVDAVRSYFAKNVDNMIYRKYNTHTTENDVKLIWTELKETFKQQLAMNKIKWIKSSTRDYALQKLDAMQLEINSYNTNDFDIEFADLDIEETDYMANIKRILEFKAKKSFRKLGKPAEPLEAGEILSYTPANLIMENKIKIPVSLLQPNFLWAANYPNALKFGTLAASIGHELIHGFDDIGRKFDKNGNSNDWWDDDSTRAFVSRTECFTEQYSMYFYSGRFLPRSPMQSENIADNGGVRIAYAAYLKWYEQAQRNNVDLQMETLPTLKYTSKQLFFISYAQFWCSDTYARVRNLQTATDQHVPGKFRVIGPLSNFDEFAKEFNCPPDSPMNPKNKCRIY